MPIAIPISNVITLPSIDNNLLLNELTVLSKLLKELIKLAIC